MACSLFAGCHDVWCLGSVPVPVCLPPFGWPCNPTPWVMGPAQSPEIPSMSCTSKTLHPLGPAHCRCVEAHALLRGARVLPHARQRCWLTRTRTFSVPVTQKCKGERPRLNSNGWLCQGLASSQVYISSVQCSHSHLPASLVLVLVLFSSSPIAVSVQTGSHPHQVFTFDSHTHGGRLHLCVRIWMDDKLGALPRLEVTELRRG